MVVVEQRVRFDAFENVKTGIERLSLMVTGIVYEVNYEHKVFHVAYTVGKNELRTSFKFCDIGTKVRVV